MFGFFSNMSNMLYPAKKFLTAVLGILKYNESTYDIDELTDQMNEKEQCELLNGSLDINELNQILKLKNFSLNKILIEKSIFVFKRNYMVNEKTILSFENIIIDIFKTINKDNDIEIKDEENKKSEGGFLETIINMVIQNLEVNFKNIKIRFFDEKNENVEYSFFIKNIEYKDAQNVEPIPKNDKAKYLFIHNKALYIDGILLKEKYEENDDIFFSNDDEDNKENKNKIILKYNNLFYIKNKIEIDIFHDKDNNILTLGNNNNFDFYIENIFNIEQLSSLYSYFIPQNDNNINKKINKNIDVEIKEEKEKEKGFNLMGFKIEKIYFEIKIWLFYFILIENKNKENNMDKLWISNNDKFNFDNLKKEDSLNGIIDHFNYIQNKYYIFTIYDLLFKLSNKQTEINEIFLKLIEPKINDNNNNINNIIKNNNELDFKQKIIFNINKFNFNKDINKYLYDNIYLEISPNIVHLLKLFSKFTKNKSPKYKYKNENKQQNELNNNINNINNEEEIIVTEANKLNEEKNLFNLNGKNLKIKIYIDKNIEENIENFSIKDIFINNDINDKFDFIDFTINDLIINTEVNDYILYDNIYINYNDTQNKIYPMLKLDDHKNKPNFINSLFTCNQNQLLIDIQFQIIFFINPTKINNILNYVGFISQLLKTPKINKVKEISINNNNNINNVNQGFNFDLLNKNIDIKIKEIKILIINEEEKYLNIEKIFTDLPQNEIEFRKNNNYICINLIDIGANLDCNKDNKKCNIHLKSIIIEDNISNSKYKILLSNYDFKNDKDILINCDIEFQKNNDKYEIKPIIKISPIAIYLDQLSLYYLYNSFKTIINKKEEENIDLNVIENNIKNNNIIINNDNFNKENYIIKNIVIEYFFIQINYETNKQVTDKEFLSKTITKYLISLKNLNIVFKPYSNNIDKFNLSNAIKNIYQFYYDYIINQFEGGMFFHSLPFLNHISSIIDGSFDIVRKPMENYKKKDSIKSGFVEGVTSCVVNTATALTYFGENINKFLNIFSCTGKSDVDGIEVNTNNAYRNLRHTFNEKNKEIEDYYFK